MSSFLAFGRFGLPFSVVTNPSGWQGLLNSNPSRAEIPDSIAYGPLHLFISPIDSLWRDETSGRDDRLLQGHIYVGAARKQHAMEDDCGPRRLGMLGSRSYGWLKKDLKHTWSAGGSLKFDGHALFRGCDVENAMQEGLGC